MLCTKGTGLAVPYKSRLEEGLIDACKNNVRFSLSFQRNFKSALYQGTTSVVPQKSQMTRALAPAALFLLSIGLRGPFGSSMARVTLPLQEPTAVHLPSQSSDR